MMRVAIGPGEVAGYFSRLKSGFDQIGVRSEHFLLGTDKYAYSGNDYFMRDRYLAASELRDSPYPAVRMAGRFALLFIKIAVFIRALFRFDVFIFSGFETFLRFHDLKILKLLNKKIIVVFLGSDARPPIFSGRHADDEQRLVDPAAAYAEAREIRRRVRLIERYADHIINHTATDQFFTRDYIRFAAVGLPVRMTDSAYAPSRNERVKIVHAPSRPVAKGTEVFRRALDDLKLEGLTFDYVELVGVPNQRVLEELASCDFILDELYSDVPMAMFATEAAMFGKPAVVGSHYAGDYEGDNPDPQRPPSVFVQPAAIKDAIRRLICDGAYRIQIGTNAREFVEQQWNATAVAQRFLEIIHERIPTSWTSNPSSNSYIWGWGLSKELWREQVKCYADRYGYEAFLFDNNETLVQKIVEELGLDSHHL